MPASSAAEKSRPVRAAVAGNLDGSAGSVSEQLTGQDESELPRDAALFRAQDRSLACCKRRVELLQGFEQELLLRGLRFLADVFQPLLDDSEVGHCQFGLDDCHVAVRVHGVEHVRDVAGGEGAREMENQVGFADVAEELVSQSFARACAFDQAGDVNEVDVRRGRLFRFQNLRDAVQPLVGHQDNADVLLDGGERVEVYAGAAGREKIEERGLADVGQTDDADLHGVSAGVPVMSLGGLKRLIANSRPPVTTVRQASAARARTSGSIAACSSGKGSST
jgi:hypothetical protein